MQQKFVRPFDAKDAGAHSSQPFDAAAELRLRSIKPLSGLSLEIKFTA